jgi:hypothetical protein
MEGAMAMPRVAPDALAEPDELQARRLTAAEDECRRLRQELKAVTDAIRIINKVAAPYAGR